MRWEMTFLLLLSMLFVFMGGMMVGGVMIEHSILIRCTNDLKIELGVCHSVLGERWTK